MRQALLAGTQHYIAGRCVTVQPAWPASHSQIAISTSNKSQPGQPTVSSNLRHNQTILYAEQNASTRYSLLFQLQPCDVACCPTSVHSQPPERQCLLPWSNTLLWSGRRDGQSQQGHVISPPASPSFTDVLHEVPTLPELLKMDDQKALSAVSRSLRNSFVAKVRVVTVACKADLALVNYSWPLLSMVILIEDDCYLPSPPSDRSLVCVGVSARPVSAPILQPFITYAEESCLCGRTSKIFMLRPLHTSASLAWASLAAQQLGHHLTANWPDLNSFSLTHLKLPALSVAIIAQLAKGNFSSLGYLKLSKCGLAAQSCLHLSQGNWPALEHLELANNGIDAEGMALLAKANWPSLLELELSYNPVLDAKAIAHLSTAKWPLLSLGLSHTLVTAAMAAELSQLQLSNLMTVSLIETGLTAAAVSELARADWAVLKTLQLDHNALDAAAIQHLCRMHMPRLERLSLQYATITDAAAFWLAQGSWPLLTDLRLSHNQLGVEATKHIASAVWPQLKSLGLEENLFDDDGLQQLSKGN